MRPIKNLESIKRINVNVSEETHRKLKQKVAKEGTSISKVLESMVNDYIKTR